MGWDQFYSKPPLKEPKPALNLDDVGPRIKHYNQLFDLWNGVLYTLLAKSAANRTTRENGMVDGLIFATELLKVAMTGANSGYDDSAYKDVINSLPRNAEEIKD
jgi:hypothetical protein